MNEWEKIKAAYLEDHYAKRLKQTSRRVSALGNVEGWLNGLSMFDAKQTKAFLSEVDKPKLIGMLEKQKGRSLNAAEVSVVTGLYKLSNI